MRALGSSKKNANDIAPNDTTTTTTATTFGDYSAPEGKQDIVLSMYVCMCAYLVNHRSKLCQIFCARYLKRPWLGSSVGFAVRYVFPVLWMTSCLHITASNGRPRNGRISLLGETRHGLHEHSK